MQISLAKYDKDFQTLVDDLENIFSVHEDKDLGVPIPNLNETAYLNLNEGLKIFITDHPLHWSIISYRLYGTVRLTWLLLKLNNVKPDSCFKRVPPATPVIYLDVPYVQYVLNAMTED